MVDKTRVCSNSNHRVEKQIFKVMENLVTDYEKWVILPLMITPRSAPTLVIPHTCLLGEGPVWDAARKTVCWVDILNGEVHEFSTVAQHHRKIDVKDMVGAIALCNNGEYIAALKTGLAFVHKDSGRIRMLHHPEVHLPGNRFNDGKCDPAGRFWVGTMALTETPGAGSLYMIDKNLAHTKKIGGVTISNGMAWTDDHQTFYYIDTPTYEVVAYRYHLSTGEITERSVVIKIPKEDGFPDGMTIDAEGMLWIAHWDGWQVTRWDPRTGEKLSHIAMPVARVTSCTFGGEHLQDLYITSAKVGLSEKQLEEQPLAGGLFVLKKCGQGVATAVFECQ